MQLTKDDVLIESKCKSYGHIPVSNSEMEMCPVCKSTNIVCREILNFSKFQQVVAFYDEYKDHPNWLYDQQLCIYVQYQKEVETIIGECSPKSDLKYRDWLFNYCFKDGLK